MWEHHKTKGWTNEEGDVCAYLPSFTSAFSVNNTFCPLISLWITWWAWRWANPCMKKRRGRRGRSELGSGLSSRVAIPSTPKAHSTGSHALAQRLGAMGPTGTLWRHIARTAFGKGAETQPPGHAHAVPKHSPTSALSREESSAPRKSPCNDTVNDSSISVRHWHLTHTGSPKI